MIPKYTRSESDQYISNMCPFVVHLFENNVGQTITVNDEHFRLIIINFFCFDLDQNTCQRQVITTGQLSRELATKTVLVKFRLFLAWISYATNHNAIQTSYLDLWIRHFGHFGHPDKPSRTFERYYLPL